jgi:hypothetical protein
MVEAKNITNQIGVVSNETDDITNKTPINYDKIYANIDEMTDLVKQRKAVDEKAYQYADGPYKELITIYLKQSELQINYLGLWKSRVQYLQQNNLYQVNETNLQRLLTMQKHLNLRILMSKNTCKNIGTIRMNNSILYN